MKSATFATALALLALATTAHAVTRPGVVSYWGRNTLDFEKIPDGGIAILNPSSGIFDSSDQGTRVVSFARDYAPVVKRAAAHDIGLFGYVPTGYFNHGCNTLGKCQTWERIEGQVKAYFATFPQLSGIFFDEAAPANWSCESYAAEYDRLRALVKTYKPDARITFNPGMADLCAINAAQPGEIVMMFESDGDAYRAQADKVADVTTQARTRGVLTWHVINTVSRKSDMLGLVELAKRPNPDYLYIIDVSGDWQAGYNTYGELPVYWRDELKAIQGPKTMDHK